MNLQTHNYFCAQETIVFNLVENVSIKSKETRTKAIKLD